MGLMFRHHLGIKRLLTPQTGTWFLLSLFFWRIALMFIKQEWLTKRNFIWLCITCVALYTIPVGDIFAYTRTVEFFPFYVGGVMLHGTDIWIKIKKVPHLVSLMIIVGWSCLIYFMHPFQDYIYSGPIWLNPLKHLERLSFLAMSLVIGFSVYNLLPSSNKLFEKWGQKTLFIYVYHLVFLKILVTLVEHFDLPTTLPYLLVYIVSYIMIITSLSNINFLNGLLQPKYLNGVGKTFYKKINNL